MKFLRTALVALSTLIITQAAAAPAFAWYYPTYRTASTTTATAPSATTTVESSLLAMLNRERTSRGLKPVQSDSALTSLARTKSRDMAANRYFSHTSPTYGTPAQMLRSAGISYRTYAENIAKGADAARIHANWMASPGHRANILNPALTHVGVGVTGGSTGYTATQLFIGR